MDEDNKIDLDSLLNDSENLKNVDSETLNKLENQENKLYNFDNFEIEIDKMIKEADNFELEGESAKEFELALNKLESMQFEKSKEIDFSLLDELVNLEESSAFLDFKNSLSEAEKTKIDSEDTKKLFKKMNSGLDNMIEEVKNYDLSSLDYDKIKVSEKEIRDYLYLINAEYDEKKNDELIKTSMGSMIDDVLGIIGLGGVFHERENDAKYDENYNSIGYHDDNKKYKEFKKEARIKAESGELKNVYKEGQNFDSNSTYDVEHIVSAKEIHENKWNKAFMTPEQRQNLANSDANLGVADSSVNRSKGSEKLREWENKLSSDDKSVLNAEKYSEHFDKKTAHKADSKARGYINKKTAVAGAKTSAIEGGKMAVNAILGAVLKEFIKALWDEIRILFKKGKQSVKDFFKSLKEALKKTWLRIKDKWRDIILANGIMGFFSGITSVLLTAFLGLAKKFVRIIRVGFFSLLNAIKLIFNRPKGMTKAEAFHAASKIIVAGFISIITTYVVLAFPQGGWLADVAVAIIGGLLSAIAMWGLDKFDLFGVNKKAKMDYVFNRIKEDEETAYQELMKELAS